MRRFALTLCLALGLALPAAAQDSPLTQTIERQFEAFRADDFATAFGFASPNIREIFRTPENFGAMVRGGYPMVWRPGSVRYLELREIAGNLWQRVEVTDAQGRTHLLDYQMIETPEGWKINGVQLLKAPEPSA